MELCYSKEHLETFILVSGDGDFSPLVAKLKENDKLPEIDISEWVTLSCSLPEIDEQLELVGIIKNFKKDERGIQLGLEFSTTYPELEQSINRYLKAVKHKSV